MATNVVLDKETLGLPPDGVVLSLGATYFTDDEFDGGTIHTLETLRARGIRIKFDVSDQIDTYGRTTDQGVIRWWNRQSDEAKAVCKRSAKDVPMKQGLEQFFDWIPDDKNIRFWSRGINFDLTLLESMMRQAGIDRLMQFWNYRDVRSFIAGAMLELQQDRVPIDADKLDGMLEHSELDDACKDVLMIMTAPLYAAGLADLPENPHPVTVPKKS